MSNEKTEAKIEKVSGNAKEIVGKVTDNEKLQSEGVVEKLKGTVKEGIEDVKDTVEGIKEGLSDKKDK